MRYRPDIDGLRAIAVLSVILYHAGYSWFGGGFVGVDIFFVISGFLITTLLIGEQVTGQFSIVRFYERRARRIMPALSFILLFCIIAAFALMLPDQLIDFGKSLVSVCFFVSNVFFWKTSGYFDAATEEKPLLHTWSLGVEEQYYIFFPLFIAFMWKYGHKRIFWLIAFGALMSLGLSEVAVRLKPTANFYLIPTRAWELFIGSLLAFASFKKPLYERITFKGSQSLSALGLLLILAPVFLYDKHTPFPSLYALAPTLGAALCIGFGHPRTVVSKLLSTKTLVWIGLISYSAYLWHQPLFAFTRIVTLNNVSPYVYGGLIAASLALAFLTWKYIEQPFRKKTLTSRKTIFLLSGFFSLFFIIVGSGIVLTQSKDTATEHLRRINFGLDQSCETPGSFTPSALCSTAEQPDTLLWGDSVAMHLVAGLKAANPDIKMIQATKSVCGPFLGIAPITLDGKYNEHWAKGCLAFNDSVHRYMAQQPSIKVVVLSSTFIAYIDNVLFDLRSPQGPQKPSVDLALQIMKKTIQTIRSHGKKVVIFAPPASTKMNVGDCLQRKKHGKPVWGAATSCAIDLQSYKDLKKDVLVFLDRLEKEADITVIRFDPLLCNTKTCTTAWEGTPLYRDAIHLSYDGSALLGRTMGFDKLITNYAR